MLACGTRQQHLSLPCISMHQPWDKADRHWVSKGRPVGGDLGAHAAAQPALQAGSVVDKSSQPPKPDVLLHEPRRPCCLVPPPYHTWHQHPHYVQPPLALNTPLSTPPPRLPIQPGEQPPHVSLHRVGSGSLAPAQHLPTAPRRQSPVCDSNGKGCSHNKEGPGHLQPEVDHVVTDPCGPRK
jgi:hypothetical protein